MAQSSPVVLSADLQDQRDARDRSPSCTVVFEYCESDAACNHQYSDEICCGGEQTARVRVDSTARKVSKCASYSVNAA